MNRRTLLGALAGGVSALAGCGYRAGGGELRWRAGVFRGVDALSLSSGGGTVLAVTREAMTFDFDTERWFEGGRVATLDHGRGEQTAEYGFESPVSVAALGPGHVYAGTTAGTVAATTVEADPRASGAGGTGTATPDPGGWSTDVGVAPSGVNAVLVEGSVYAGGADGLAALSPRGSVRWRWAGEEVVAVAPGGGDVSVYALATDRLAALAADGTVRWTHDVTAEGVGSRAVAPRVDAGGVYLADAAGLTALAHDGSVGWRRDVGDPACRPALSGGAVYHAAVDGTVRSFSPDGRERWAHDPRGRVDGLDAADGRAYVLVGRELAALGPGGTVWRAPLDVLEEPFTPEFGPLAAGRTLVVAGSGEVRGYWRSQLR